MSIPIMTQVERIDELSAILLQMTKEVDNKKFWQLDRKFQSLKEIYKLEDEINHATTL